MNGPQLVCAGCGEPTKLNQPVCDDCLQMAREQKPGYCALCDSSAVQPAKDGIHLTKSGGYAGRCTA